MKGIKSFRRTFLLIAALYLACGISLLVWPAQSGLVICYVFGGISLLYGAVQIIRYAATLPFPFSAMNLSQAFSAVRLACLLSCVRTWCWRYCRLCSAAPSCLTAS